MSLLGNLEARLTVGEDVAVIGSIEPTLAGVAIGVGFTTEDGGWCKTHHLELSVAETVRLIARLADSLAARPDGLPSLGLGI